MDTEGDGGGSLPDFLGQVVWVSACLRISYGRGGGWGAGRTRERHGARPGSSEGGTEGALWARPRQRSWFQRAGESG